MKTLLPLKSAYDGLIVCATDRALSRMKVKLHLEDNSGIGKCNLLMFAIQEF